MIQLEVDRLFAGLNVRGGDRCSNPVVGGNFLLGEDPLAPQKRLARLAMLVCRSWTTRRADPSALHTTRSNATETREA
jgi:hypothetical protein